MLKILPSQTNSLAMKEKVEENLATLERIGVISKDEKSKWATPTAPVRKPNGSVLY